MRIDLKLAAEIHPHVTGMDWDTARDFIDQYTGNELDCKQLDLLTDWSMRGAKPPVQNGECPQAKEEMNNENNESC